MYIYSGYSAPVLKLAFQVPCNILLADVGDIRHKLLPPQWILDSPLESVYSNVDRQIERLITMRHMHFIHLHTNSLFTR